MLILQIRYKENGKYPVSVSTEAKNIALLPEQFHGDVKFTGTIRKSGATFHVSGEVSCSANLVCDLSAEMYKESITAIIEAPYIINTDLYIQQKDMITDAEPPYYIPDDANTIDISEEVRQQLTINLPLKRIAPKYRGKSVEDLYPEFTAKELKDIDSSEGINEEVTDERWAALKNIKFD